MRHLFFFAFLAAMIFSSCEFNVKTKPVNEAKASKIRNGITVKSNGIKVEQAFLLYEDGKLVPDDNKIHVNQKIQLRLVTSGWKENEGKVFLGAAEKVETSDGDTLLDERDMFKDYPEGLSPKDAELISLSVVITEIGKLYDYFKVTFRVEDKTDGSNFVEGFYKLYLN